MPAVHRVRFSAVLRHCPVVLLRQGRYREVPSLPPLLNTLVMNIHAVRRDVRPTSSFDYTWRYPGRRRFDTLVDCAPNYLSLVVLSVVAGVGAPAARALRSRC